MANTLYTDIKTNFDAHPNTQDLVLLRMENAVKNSIRNLVYTQKYERFRKPGIGAGIPQELFENFTLTTEYTLRERIIEVIRTYEPRVDNVNVIIIAEHDKNYLTVKIAFTVINIDSPVSFDMILKRVR